MLKSTALILAASIVYVGLLIRNIRRRKTLMEHFIFTAFYFYIVAVLSITLFPIPIDQAMIASDLADGIEWEHNFIPFYDFDLLFVDPDPWYGMGRQIVGNTLLLLPLGVYVSLRKSALKPLQVVLTGLASSASIELTQVLLCTIIGYNYRIFDVDDLMLNTLGFTIGYFGFKLLSLLWTKYVDGRAATSASG